ncbi:MAG: hypothetical protein HFE73_08405 [Firmicutes bacterium]|nr:hypothetical protein [Bacillota bacterium]
MNEEKQVLFVSVLGKFSIQKITDKNDIEKNAEKRESAPLKQRSFLQYLCVFHDRDISQEEIIDAIWDTDSDVGDPANTLKNTLYRTRILLEKIGFSDGKQLLRYDRGFYSWNPNLEIVLDSEEFDKLYDFFYNDPNTQKSQDAAEKALRLYKGEFLANAAGNPWMLSMRTYYHGKYLNLIRDMARLLYEKGSIERGAELCREATTIDPFDEESQLLMMRILYASGLTQAAIQHYEMVRSMFMEQLGVTPSEELSEFYRRLVREDEPREQDLNVIRTQMLEETETAGAYFCEYSVFRSMYRFIARSTVRSGQIIQLAMLILYDQDNNHLPAKRCNEAMEAMRESIQNVLRTGDVFTRFSRDQYLIMLPSASHENAAMALGRVIEAFHRTFAGKTTRTQVSILPVLPPKALGVHKQVAEFSPIPNTFVKKIRR